MINSNEVTKSSNNSAAQTKSVANKLVDLVNSSANQPYISKTKKSINDSSQFLASEYASYRGHTKAG